jgi:hypothetical protein
MLEVFRIHRENGGDTWVPQTTENPIGMELDVHFGMAIHQIQITYARIRAGLPQHGDRWMTEEVIREFEDVGFLWVSPNAGNRGRPRGNDTVPRGDAGTRIYIAALREFRRQNPNTELKIFRSRENRGSVITIEFEGEVYEGISIGGKMNNLRKKKSASRMTPEEYFMWSNENMRLQNYSISRHLPEEYDRNPETLRARLEARGMSSQEHQMWTEHGVDLGEYDPQCHTPLDPLDTLAQGE